MRDIKAEYFPDANRNNESSKNRKILRNEWGQSGKSFGLYESHKNWNIQIFKLRSFEMRGTYFLCFYVPRNICVYTTTALKHCGSFV